MRTGVQANEVGDDGFAARQGAGLVERDAPDRREALEDDAALMRTPLRAPVPRAATSVMGTEITSAQGAAATMKTTARCSAAFHEKPSANTRTAATRSPPTSTAGL